MPDLNRPLAYFLPVFYTSLFVELGVENAMAEPTVMTLDVRDMAPRERHPTIFDRLEALDPGDALRLVNIMIPLRYQLLAEYPNMFNWEPEKQGPNEWIIRIQKIEADPR